MNLHNDNINDNINVNNNINNIENIENIYVKNVYEDIANHFDNTRVYTWPWIDEFLNKLAPYSSVYDIGCGNGEYTAAYANAFQEKHIIATEVYLSGIGSLIGLINKYKISNISIFDEDVRLLMDQMPKEFLDSVNILFPDPWQKAKHHKRRLVGEDFLYQLHPLLKPNAKIFVRTDWEDYAEQISELAEVMSSHFRLEKTQNIEFEFETRFHQRAIKENREISSFLFTKL